MDGLKKMGVCRWNGIQDGELALNAIWQVGM